MDDALNDLVIGNIDVKLPDMSHFSAGVIIRAQAKQEKKHASNTRALTKFD